MGGLNVEITEHAFEEAFERSRKASAVRRKFPKLVEWERYESQPTLRKLDKRA
jgi:hypothetical protein